MAKDFSKYDAYIRKHYSLKVLGKQKYLLYRLGFQHGRRKELIEQMRELGGR